jgi:DNA-binding response OmpR family regulator
MPLTVLAVEHDPALRNLYYALLAERGHRVRVVPSGEEAVSELDMDIDVVVVDLRSKQSRGRVVLDAVRARAAYQKVPVLIVDGREDDATAGIESHAMTLPKPFVFERFVQAVESLASRRRRQN